MTTGHVVVGVCDTGVDRACAELISRVRLCAAWNGHGEPVDPDRVEGRRAHGTAVAAEVVKVAPDVRLDVAIGLDHGWVVLRTLRALDWLVGRPIDVLLLPFGLHPPTPLYDPLLRRAADRGILTIAAIGNLGAGRATSPGCSPHVLSVGAVTPDGLPAGFSGSVLGPDGVAVFPHVLAPSASATGCGTIAGTSVAAGHVAGVAARLLSEVRDATASGVRQALIRSSVHTTSVARPAARAASCHGLIGPAAGDHLARDLSGPPTSFECPPATGFLDGRLPAVARWATGPVPVLIRFGTVMPVAEARRCLARCGLDPATIEPADSAGTLLARFDRDRAAVLVDRATRIGLELVQCVDLSALGPEGGCPGFC